MSERRDVIIGRAFGIGAALAYGIGAVLTREGVAGLAPPLVGAAVALLSGTLGLTLIRIWDFKTWNLSKANLAQNKRPIVLLLIAGVTASFGVAASFFAFSLAPVVVIAPILNTGALFTLLGSYLFLGQLEKITPKLVLGSILVVVGVIVISIGRQA